MLLNRERAMNVMEKYDLDVLIASNTANMTYLSDFAPAYFRGFAAFPGSEAVEPWLIVAEDERYQLDFKKSWIRDIRTYLHDSYAGDFSWSSRKRNLAVTEALISSLRDKGLGDGRLGLDEADFLDFLRNRLPDATLVSVYDVFTEIRMVKTSEEVERLRRAAKIAEKGIRDVFSVVEEGVTETLLAQAYFESVTKQDYVMPCPLYLGCNGGIRVAWGNGVCGGPTPYGHYEPLYIPRLFHAKKGDVIMIDGGCVYKSYWSDTGRSMLLGEPTDQQKHDYETTCEAHQNLVDAVKADIRVSDLYKVAVKTLRKHGISPPGWLYFGHGIGIEPYDPPLIGPDVDLRLEKNMVLNVEYPCGGFHLEDTLLVTDDRPEFLTTNEWSYSLSLG